MKKWLEVAFLAAVSVAIPVAMLFLGICATLILQEWLVSL